MANDLHSTTLTRMISEATSVFANASTQNVTLLKQMTDLTSRQLPIPEITVNPVVRVETPKPDYTAIISAIRDNRVGSLTLDTVAQVVASSTRSLTTALTQRLDALIAQTQIQQTVPNVINNYVTNNYQTVAEQVPIVPEALVPAIESLPTQEEMAIMRYLVRLALYDMALAPIPDVEFLTNEDSWVINVTPVPITDYALRLTEIYAIKPSAKSDFGVTWRGNHVCTYNPVIYNEVFRPPIASVNGEQPITLSVSYIAEYLSQLQTTVLDFARDLRRRQDGDFEIRETGDRLDVMLGETKDYIASVSAGLSDSVAGLAELSSRNLERSEQGITSINQLAIAQSSSNRKLNRNTSRMVRRLEHMHEEQVRNASRLEVMATGNRDVRRKLQTLKELQEQNSRLLNDSRHELIELRASQALREGAIVSAVQEVIPESSVPTLDPSTRDGLLEPGLVGTYTNVSPGVVALDSSSGERKVINVSPDDSFVSDRDQLPSYDEVVPRTAEPTSWLRVKAESDGKSLQVLLPVPYANPADNPAFWSPAEAHKLAELHPELRSPAMYAYLDAMALASDVTFSQYVLARLSAKATNSTVSVDRKGDANFVITNSRPVKRAHVGFEE